MTDLSKKDVEEIKKAIGNGIIYKKDKPVIIPSKGYDFCQYYVFERRDGEIYIHGVERRFGIKVEINGAGWEVYSNIAVFAEEEFKKFFI
jgi:hypothetical protein